MHHLRYLLLIILLSATLVYFTGCKNSDLKKPNIVIILSDDQGWGDLSINGNVNISTPNIDNLARNGVVMNNFYVSPVCSPTRADLLTGRYHVRGGVYGTSAGRERLDLDEVTIADIFKSAGYRTAAYGKWHNGMQPPYHPNARGFDDYYGFCSGHWGNYFSPMLEHNGQLVEGEGYIVDDLTDHGIRFIEKNKAQPFFLYLPYNTPHSPMQVPDRWWNKFENNALEKFHRDKQKEDINFTRAALAMCENIDYNVGRIVSTLEELELVENTIVIYFSDNGPNSWRWNGGMKGRKGSTDEGGVRSPMFIQWAGNLEAGRTINEISGAIDLLPTLVDLAGIEYNYGKLLDGISLKPLLIEGEGQWKDRFIYSYWNNKTSVRNQQYRLDHEGRLFDMIADPGQYQDVSVNYPDIHEKLLQAKDHWVEDVLYELPEIDNRPFTIGHPDFVYTQIPARDGKPHGNIQRSNRFPNDSYFLNWTSTEDKITWEVEVLADGEFEVEIYYTCPEESTGSRVILSFNEAKLIGSVEKAHDPPVMGMGNDRVPRVESYVKDFKPMAFGTIHLKRGKGQLTLQAEDIPGKEVMEFRLMMFKRLTD